MRLIISLQTDVEIKEAFDFFSENGVLTKDQFGQMCRALGFPISDCELMKIVLKEGEDELTEAMAKAKIADVKKEADHRTPESLTKHFEVLDFDGNGFISMDEFISVMQDQGIANGPQAEPMSEAEVSFTVANLENAVDPEGNRVVIEGKVYWKSFVSWAMQMRH